MRQKRGLNKKQKHKKILSLTKGYRMSYNRLYRKAKEAVLHAGAYSFYHRKHRRAQKRREWIKTISNALVNTRFSYSEFIFKLKEKDVLLNRKSISEMIITKFSDFESLLKTLS